MRKLEVDATEDKPGEWFVRWPTEPDKPRKAPGPGKWVIGVSHADPAGWPAVLKQVDAKGT
jgi:hypothetical protein